MSRLPDRGPVDEFGRDRPGGQGHSNGGHDDFYRRDDRDRERGRHMGGGGGGRRSGSRDRRPPSPPFHGGYRGHPGGGGYGGGGHHFGGGRGGGERRGQAQHHQDVYLNAIKSTTFRGVNNPAPDDVSYRTKSPNLSTFGPMSSFKNFVTRLKSDIPPEECQQSYNKYHREYVQQLSGAFFNTVVAEEWFQDRYNPINLQRIEKESTTWAIEESGRFRDEFYQYPVEFLAACSLDPTAKFNQHKSQSNTNITISEGSDGIATDTVESSNEQTSSTITTASGTHVSGKHLSGHENRTVYISEIHASCPKSFFKEAIITRLQSRGVTDNTISNQIDNTTINLQPERILISQPMWNLKNIEKFERCAWIVMPTIESAKKAVDLLKPPNEIIVPRSIREPLKDRNSSVLALQFKVQASLHSSRMLNNLPDFMSQSNRIYNDIERAMKLASLLDEERDIPETNRLYNILLNANDRIMELFELPTQHLDVCIAYLRRVHFLSFYAGKIFPEESYLLAMSSSVVYRNKPYQPAIGEGNTKYNLRNVLNNLSFTTTMTTTNDDDHLPDEEDGQQHQHHIESDNHDDNMIENGGEGIENEQKDIENTSDSIVPSTLSSSGNTMMIKSNRIPTIASDKKLSPLIAKLTARLEEKRRRKQQIVDESVSSSSSSLVVTMSNDESDAKAIEEAMQTRLERFVIDHCGEAEDKCRCCFSDCNKLFKASTFLIKHLKMKHDAFAFCELAVQDAEPYMSKRYQEEPLEQQPLPPIHVETSNGLEVKSVREVLSKSNAPGAAPLLTTPPPPLSLSDSYHYQAPHHRGSNGGYDNQRRRNSHDGEGFGDHRRQNFQGKRRFEQQDDNRGGGDRRQSWNGPSHYNQSNNDQSPPQKHVAVASSDDKVVRKLPMYVDVDAPKEQLVSIDHTLLPPPKKRKFGGSGAAAAGASPN